MTALVSLGSYVTLAWMLSRNPNFTPRVGMHSAYTRYRNSNK